VTKREGAEEYAQKSDAAIHALIEAAPEAVLAHNKEGRVVLANAAAEAMFGYSRQELMGQPLSILIPERFRQRHAEHVASFFLKPRRRQMGSGLGLFALRKGGSEFPVEIGLSHFETPTGPLVVSFISDITERQKSEATVLQYQKELQSLTGRLLSVQEAGNKELARELHDDLSQKLAALGMEVSMLLESSRESPELLPERVRAIGAKISRLAEGVHALSRRLHPAILDELGLEAALKEECVGFSAQEGVPARFESERVPAAIPEDISLCLYRVAQESLRNIAKHAKATNVRVLLSGRPDGIALHIKDTGGGFDLNEVKEKGGLGLISMEERVRLVNGSLKIQSQAGQGTTVEVFVPLLKKEK
jgi:PAS domain S-box-containing protein